LLVRDRVPGLVHELGLFVFSMVLAVELTKPLKKLP
jgi:hypothetical protein